MSNQFVSRKSASRPLGRRALMRRLRPTSRQKSRIIAGLKDNAAALIRKGLDQRLADESSAEPPTP